MRIVKIAHILKLNKKRIAILAAIIIAVILGFNFFFKPKQQNLQFVQVKRQDIVSTVSSSGILTGKEIANLKFKSSGKLTYLTVKVGDIVYAYQTIAGLDTQDLAISLQQAQNTLRDKQATAEKVEDDVKDNDDDETYTQRATRTTAQVARDNAYDEIKAAEKALQDAYLFSPIGGIVTQAPFVVGQNVSASDVIAQVVDFSQVYFDTEIDEADIGKISLDQKAEVTLDAYPDQVFEGVVSEIIPQTKTTSSGATVVTVRIKLTDPKITPINGLSGQALIILSEAKNTMVVPLETVRDDKTVFVQTAQGLRPQKVETGIRSDTDVEVKDGLNENDKILLNPPSAGTRIQNRNPLQRIIFR